MKRRLLVPLGLALLLAILLMPILTGLIREVVVIPLLYILWIGQFLVETLPQGVIWSLFVICLLVMMLISLAGKQRRRVRRPPIIITNQERIEIWLYLIRQAERDGYFKWRLAQHLQRLTVDAIAHYTDQTSRQTRQQLKQGLLDLPPELQAYFQTSLKPLGYLPAKRFFAARATPPSPLDLDPIRVAQYLGGLEADTITIQRRYDDR
jgi:hypothetical protein